MTAAIAFPAGRPLVAAFFAGCGMLACLAFSGSALAAACENPMQSEAALAGKLGGPPLGRTKVADFYQIWGAECAWTDRQAAQLQTVLSDAARHGLDPQYFHQAEIRALTPPANDDSARKRDILLTDAALQYSRIMTQGQVDLAKIETDIDFPRARSATVEELKAALSTDRLGDWLAKLPPQAPAYQRLKEALSRYQGIAAAGGWNSLPDGPSLKPGNSDSIVADLRQRLVVEGDLHDPGEGLEYDAPLVEAVIRFQKRHGLVLDGIVGPKTRAALNMPVAGRINQIMVNLERWRWLSRIIPPTRFEVNTAAAVGRLVVDHEPALIMRAIVGDSKHPTPMLMSRVIEVVLNPIWTVPPSIVRKEISLAIRRDPKYLIRNHMYWTNGKLVQKPGEDNALGFIKFNFVNPFGVYMHDTPARGLFAMEERARSHGCVRLERPLDMAAYLLRADLNWPRENIEKAITGGKTVRIPSPDQLPVVFTYWTAFVTRDGTIQFRDDIYGRDARLMAAIAPSDATSPASP